MVLAATFALVVFGAVRGLQLVEGADASGWRAGAAEARALAEATRALRWQASLAGGSASGGDQAAGWAAAWQPALPVAGQVWPREMVHVETTSGSATSRDDAVLELRSEPWAMGVTCAGDAEIAAPLEVSGSGVYVGGCLRGRENVSFSSPAGSAPAGAAPADEVRGEVYPLAGVHGGAGIFAGGLEIHASGGDEYPDDSDRDAGLPVSLEWVSGPSAEFLLAARTEATPPGPALTGGLLRLDELSVATGDAAAAGRCVLLPELDEVTIEGTSAPGAGRLLVVVQGDAVLGRPGEAVTLLGGLVVSGHLEVRGPLAIAGTLHAGSLSVGAPVAVAVNPGWRASPLPGALAPSLVELGS